MIVGGRDIFYQNMVYKIERQSKKKKENRHKKTLERKTFLWLHKLEYQKSAWARELKQQKHI